MSRPSGRTIVIVIALVFLALMLLYTFGGTGDSGIDVGSITTSP